MNNQLSNISTQYRKFSKGQYIEHTQFNEFLDFFEDQDRLSRVMLEGVGIVCGLKPELIYTSSLLSSIQLSQGVALTTDGDLLTLNKISEVSEELYVSDLKTIKIDSEKYTHFKVYDNFKAKYPAFHDESGEQIALWELAPIQDANSNFQPINNLLNLEDKYLLLYLENYEKEVKPCRGVDCDNHGIQQIRNLKVLVTTAQGINHILEKDHIQPHPLFIEDILGAVKQERVIVERLILEKGIDAHFLSSDVKEMYSTVLERNGYGEVVFEKINAISQIIGIPAVDHQSFKNALEECLAQTAGFQYAYDVVKDLMDTYSEIIKLLPKSFTKCLPDLVSFPKHIMLGKLISNTQLDSSRHQFYNSPVLDDEKATRKVKVLLNRFKLQAQNFRYSDGFESVAEIKITPSQKLDPLSNKAVPFYYEVTEEFLKAWNFDKTGNRSFTNNLGYDTSLLSSDEYVQKPTYFNIDKNSFYNIEGHQGMSYEDAFEQIKQIGNEQQLGFDVMGLSFNELLGNKDLFKAYFNEYVEKHPGLEHKRGVERGGTFVMVYENVGRDSRVIADFSIPYICCTPKVDVKLTLPSTVICNKADAVPFTVFPMNGDVKAVVDADSNGGVELREGKYFFNPGLVSPGLYNKNISFTVNEKPTNCTIKVIPQSNVNIVVDSVVYPSGDSNTTTVNFTVSGPNFASYNYNGDFWDKGSWVNLNPNGTGHFSYTYYDLNPSVIPTIKVNVSSGGCIQTIIIDDWYDAPSAPSVVINNIDFSDGEDCCEGAVPTITAGIEGPIRLPLSAGFFTLVGKEDSGAPTLIYSWTKIEGPTVTLIGINQPNLKVTDLVVGQYKFQLTILDADSGVFAKAEAEVTVYEEAK